MTRRVARLSGVLAVLTICGSPAMAEEVPAALRACAHEFVDSRRLACFDTQLARLTADQRSVSSGTTPAAPSAPVPTSAIAAAPPAPRESSSPKPTVATGPKQMTAQVASLQHQPDGKLILHLDNGQVWEQTESVPYFPIKTGDPVTITKGAFTSFWLKTPGAADRIRVKLDN